MDTQKNGSPKLPQVQKSLLESGAAEEVEEIPYGYCHCGCGKKTLISKANIPQYGWIKGEHRKFIQGHNMRNLDCSTYPTIYKETHLYVTKARIRKHVLIAEKALGKPLPLGACVHHVNGTKNSGQLVICQDNAYHMLLHQRARALKACGHASWRKCVYCKQYNNPDKLVLRKEPGSSAFHRECYNQSQKCNRLKRLQRRG